MEGRDDAEGQEDRPSSPYWALQQISEEAFRVAGEALQSVYNGSPSLSPLAPGHRRSQSEVMTAGHRRSNSLQRLKVQMQKAWRWGSNLQEESPRSNFNPEILANQKRQWYQLHSKTMDNSKFKEPTSLFEHFIIAGLQSDTNLEVVEDAFARRKRWESEMAKSETLDFGLSQYRGPSPPALEPQARLLERTPSLSDLNELVYGQEHLGRDDLSFIFSFKMADGSTLYGVCLHAPEIVQRPPGIFGNSSPLPMSSSGCRFLVSAPRCYCVLTRVPFFELHYEMLNSIIAQERLNRITQFVNEMALTTYIPSDSNSHEEVNENASYSPDSSESQADWTTSAIPLHSAIALTAAAAGLVPDDGVTSPSLKNWEPQSPESVTTSETSELSHSRESDRDGAKSSLYIDDNTSEASESRFNSSGRMNGCYGNGHASPDVGAFFNLRSRTMERLGSPDSLFSPVRSLASEDEDDDLFTNSDKDVGDDVIMDWAREHKNDLLQIVCSYHALPLPSRGNMIVFRPLEHLQAIEYHRPPVSALGLPEVCLDLLEPAEVNAKMAAAEEALALSIWTTATTCRVLSLESILAVFAGVLLEKQVVLTCPNLGVLSATVLSLIPIIRPFEWQCLLIPVLPGRMLDFLEAPVPFIVGVQQKPADFKIKTSNLVHVNVLKDQVKMCHLPTLPQYRELISQLRPIHARLSCENSIARRHPVYRCNEVQAEAAARFLTVMRNYLESLCSELRSHTITSVQSNNDRVSLLLKDSFIDSFPNCDRAFIKLLVDTQMFSALSDARLSTYESMRF
ncbi:uncharacterized protein LOC116188080 isoform X2 [Punica granatum]|uniref:Uncharacterized protein LOC116188080 isoform X2 n=1 Tax=Punica granatum TaxID=22663 RepID=A0A6P8BQP9_PUNGR|nr:uncharacterized protein LOC116188080 isoform X2 [Punica granatum]